MISLGFVVPCDKDGLGQELQLPWAGLAAQHSQRIGGGQCWVAVGKTGERLDLRRP